MALSKRLEQIKKARSLNDILAVIDDITFDLKNSKAVVGKLIKSLSAEISFDRGSSKPRVKETFKAPNAKELQKHVDVIDRLWDNQYELDAAEASVKQAFAGHKKQKAALAAIADLKAEVEAALTDAVEALTEIAEQHLPSKLKTLSDRLISYLIDTLDSKMYKSIVQQTMVSYDRDDKHVILFSVHLIIQDLKTESGFRYSDYDIILTGRLDKEGVMTTFINSFPDFKKAPGRFPIGKEVKSIEDAKRRVGFLLTHNDIHIALDRLPMPIDDVRARNLGFHTLPGVERSYVKDDALRVVLKDGTSPKVESEIIKSVLARLGAIIDRETSTIPHKASTISGKRTLTFLVAPKLDIGNKAKHVNLEQLDEIATMLNLSDSAKKAMRFALQN